MNSRNVKSSKLENMNEQKREELEYAFHVRRYTKDMSKMKSSISTEDVTDTPTSKPKKNEKKKVFYSTGIHRIGC